MDTALAAAQAGVSVATIRTWCRLGAVSAVKQAGRWVVDPASLAARIAIGKRRTRRTTPAAWTVETMVAIGGSEWQRGHMHRVYFNNWAQLAGLEVACYKSGNIRDAAWHSESISNSQAYKILGCIDKVWFDAADGKLHCRYGFDESRVAGREEVFQAVASGIRTALATA